MLLQNVLSLLVLSSVCLSCQPPDCDRKDCGTCGNACCTLEFSFGKDPKMVNDVMVQAFKMAKDEQQLHKEEVESVGGGADGRYKWVGGEDYTKDNITIKYQLQATHTTLVHHYNDTLNFWVAPEGDHGSLIRGFSISDIEGALCDDGQNYKNLVGYVKGLGIPFREKTISGCPM